MDTVLNLGDNQQPWSDFLQAFILSNDAAIFLSMDGEVNLLSNFSLGVIPITSLPVAVEVSLAPMRGLHDVVIESFDVPADSPIAGVEVVSTVSINNPSVAGMDLGTVVLVLQHDTVTLGQMTLRNFTLAPGLNTLKAVGYISPTFVDPFDPSPPAPDDRQAALNASAEFISQYLTNVTQPLIVRYFF